MLNHLDWGDEDEKHEDTTKQIKNAGALSEDLQKVKLLFVSSPMFTLNVFRPLVNYLSIDVVDVEVLEDDAEGFKAPSYPKHKEQLCVENLRFAFLVTPWIKYEKECTPLAS